MAAEEKVKQGMNRKDALRAVRLESGNLEVTKETVRSAGWEFVLETCCQDLRYAFRTLRKSPGFTATAIFTLALGIGANTAIFQLLDAVRLRSLPVSAPQELAEVRIVGGNQGMGINPGRYGQLTRPLWREIQAGQRAFSGVFAWSADDVRVGK